MPITFTPPQDWRDALRQAALLWGIEAEYHDIWGNHHVVDDQVVVSILTTLGVPSGTLEELTGAIQARLIADWEGLAPSTVVAFEDEVTIPLNIRPDRDLTFEAAFEWESGGGDRVSGTLASLETEATAYLNGLPYLRKKLTARPAPLGYHKLSLKTEGGSRTIDLIVCPRRAYLPPALADGGKAAGLAVSLYGLRSRRNWGCGDFTDLLALVEWAARNELAFVALNPLHAIPNRQPYNTSPYLPTSILYRNILYLDVTAVADWCAAREEPPGASDLRDTEFVEYERVYKLKRKALRAAFRRFLKAEWNRDSPRALEFRRYLEHEGESLRQFALYCALDEWIHRDNPEIWLWTDWPAEYQAPRSEEVEAFAREHWRMVLFYQYAQWQVDCQLRDVQAIALALGMPIGLYHDLALATDRTGADVWAHPEFYMKGCRVGSPPDDFSPDGQDWAFPPPNTQRHFDTGYRLFAEGVRKTARHGGALRIDHVMRLFRLFWIPDGLKAAAGAYVKDRAADLLKILALESVRGRMLIVGEDLGTVGDETRAALSAYGILSYKLLFFEKYGDGRFRPADEYPAQALASTTTHDLPTLAGFWSGRDIAVRREVGLVKDDASYHHQIEARVHEKRRLAEALGLPESAAGEVELPDSAVDAVIGFLASTPCLLFCLNQEDLTKSIEQLNVPGTTNEHPNWRRKMAFTVEELDSSGDARRMTAVLREWLERTGRAIRRP